MTIIGNYNGGKGNIYQKLINLMPPHATYIEPFVGGGSVAVNKRPAAQNVLIDMDEAVTAAWREHLSEASPQMAMGSRIANNGDAFDTISLMSSPFSTMAAPIAIADVHRVPSHLTVAANTIINNGVRWHVITGDSVQWLKAAAITPRTLIYADPPYLADTRASTRPLYKHEMMTVEEHAALLTVLLSLDCMVMISGYWSALYAEMLDGWETAVIPTFTRAHRPVDEYVWMNFPAPTALHDYSFLGDGYRERERIKRKVKRWSEKWKCLPLLERQAIMMAMVNYE